MGGAGISTACGIPDYRTGFDTVLETGVGGWTKRDHKKGLFDANKKNPRSKATKKRKGMAGAIPSYSHMALCRLMEEDRLKFLISQNTDGMHLRSGIDPRKIAELHGNGDMMKCTNKECDKRFMHDQGDSYGRIVKCPNCGSKVSHSIINFAKSLPDKELGEAFENTRMSDLCLVLGSSVMVYPAAKMPAEVGAKTCGDLVIVNLQKTPLDDLCSVRIHAKIDDVMRRVMAHLKLTPSPFSLCRTIQITRRQRVLAEDEKAEENDIVTITAIHPNGDPCHLFHAVRSGENEAVGWNVPLQPQFSAKRSEAPEVTLVPQGHYKEPVITLTVPVLGVGEQAVRHLHCLAFDPQQAAKGWNSTCVSSVRGHPGGFPLRI